MTSNSEKLARLVANVVAQTQKDFQTASLEMVDAWAAATEQTPMAEDLAWVASERESAGSDVGDALDAIIEERAKAIFLLIATIDDHLHALDILLRDDGPALRSAVLTTARGALEASLLLCHLLDPNVGPGRRIVRSAAWFLDSVQGSERASKEFPESTNGGQQGRAGEAVEGLHKYLESHGFVLGRVKPTDRYASNLAYGSYRDNIVVNIADAARRFMPHANFSWSVLSGAAHSKGWFMPTAYPSVAPGDPDVSSEPSKLHATAALMMFSTMDALYATLGAHVGWKSQHWIDRVHFRRRALLAEMTGKGFSPVDFATYLAGTGIKGPGRAGDGFRVRTGG